MRDAVNRAVPRRFWFALKCGRLKRALLLVSIASWFTVSVVVGALIVRPTPQHAPDVAGHRTDLFRQRLGKSAALVYVYCANRSLGVSVRTQPMWGLGGDQIDVGFAGLKYQQLSYRVGWTTFDVTIPAWAWFSATFAAPAALLLWRWRRRKSAESRRGFAVRTDRTTTASDAASA